MSATVTEDIRQMVIKRMSPCPTCGKERGMSLRAIEAESGVPFNTVARFVRGKPVSSSTLDRLGAWVGWIPR